MINGYIPSKLMKSVHKIYREDRGDTDSGGVLLRHTKFN